MPELPIPGGKTLCYCTEAFGNHKAPSKECKFPVCHDQESQGQALENIVTSFLLKAYIRKQPELMSRDIGRKHLLHGLLKSWEVGIKQLLAFTGFAVWRPGPDLWKDSGSLEE